MNANEVYEIFGRLLKSLENVSDEANNAVSEALRESDFERAQDAIKIAARLAELRKKVSALQKEWARLFVPKTAVAEGKNRGRRLEARLPRGLRTPEDAFRRPILEALVELGGSAPASKILDRVEQKMKNVLNEYDYQTLPSDPRTTRWRNTARWCRQALIYKGFLKDDSPYGVWEISEKGRKWIENEKE